MDKSYTFKKISDDTIEMVITIPSEPIKSSYEVLIKKEVEKTNVKGFRKGTTPRELVEKQLQPSLLFEVINRLAPMYLSTAVEKEKIALIASPEYKEIPTLELGKDVTITVHLTIMPEFKLGNMKKVKVELKEEKVKTEEVDSILKQLEENKEVKGKMGSKEWLSNASKLIKLEKEATTLEELKENIERILTREKENIVRRTAENSALDQAISLSGIKVPEPAVHFEAHEREHSFMHQLESMKMTAEQYAQMYGVTFEQMRDMWHKDAKQALETDVFLKLFAESKKISVTEEEVNTEIEKLKNSNTQSSDVYDNEEWKEYIRKITLKQKAYTRFIEDVMQKKKK